MNIPVGVSSCLLGHQVRFDGGHKRNHFVNQELAQWCDFTPFCPEVAIGLSIPRPTIRLMRRGERTLLVESKAGDKGYTDKMLHYAEQTAASAQALRGLIVTSKSPSCGMARVKLFNESGQPLVETGSGLFTGVMMQKMPWLPVEESGRLTDAKLRENFVLRVFLLHDFYTSLSPNAPVHDLMQFHSRQKMQLMAHSPQAYRRLGNWVAQQQGSLTEENYAWYRQALMQSVCRPASKKGHCNVLMHMQGYFKKQLNRRQKAEMTTLVDDYRKGTAPLVAPLTLIKHYLDEFPNNWLNSQSYIDPYPQQLRLRYGL